jgi:hypothetical protein
VGAAERLAAGVTSLDRIFLAFSLTVHRFWSAYEARVINAGDSGGGMSSFQRVNAVLTQCLGGSA